VESQRLGDRARSRLIHLLSDDHPEPSQWVDRLKSFREFENAPAFATAVRFLFNLDLPDEEAERLMACVLEHRVGLAAKLRRDPGLRVAAMDYLSNVERRYDNPKIVEMQEFEETERSARTDPATGLANRRVFDDTLDREIRRSRRYRWPLTVLMLDLDRFKAVNDRYGHLLGDLVLERVGGILRSAVREADALCRYGGDEFAVVLPETSRIGGFAVAERIRRRMTHAFQERGVGGHEFVMTVSCGLATYPDDGLHANEIVARADEALYGAKRAGRDRVCVHHREKRSAFRFPVKTTTVVRFEGAESRDAHPVNLSRTGLLFDTSASFRVADRLAMRLERSVVRADEETCPVAGRVVRVDADPKRPGLAMVGVAFDAPIPEDRLMARVSLARNDVRAGRGAQR
jgi:diguanylate cyclase (GGDEF)-like protein